MIDPAELPGMSLMEHLKVPFKRILLSAVYLGLGFIVAGIFYTQLVAFIQAPLKTIGMSLVMTHPMDALNLDIQVSLIGGAILASPFIFYQVWLLIAPGLYQKEKRFVVPFMAATVVLFLSGAAFGYYWVLPGALKILVVDFGHNFTPVITIEEYANFSLRVILGLGIALTIPVLLLFLYLLRIAHPRLTGKNLPITAISGSCAVSTNTPSQLISNDEVNDND
jgi:sec-independent protein translocase protein TatC